jgi:GNAT superfamily N-acetyltransferase
VTDLAEIAFRRPHEDDIKALPALHVLCWQQAYAGILPKEYLETLSVDDRAKGWRDTISDPEVFKLVACDDQRIVGFVTAGPARDNAVAYGDGEIYAIYNHSDFYYNHSDFYRKGIGRNFLARAAEFWLAKGGRSLVVLFIGANTQAEMFYQSLGGIHVWEGLFEIGGVSVSDKAQAFYDLAQLAATIDISTP